MELSRQQIRTDRDALIGELKRAGARFKGSSIYCPFHDDKNKPSLWVDAERNLFGCRACDARGDVINFVAMLEGWTIQETIKNMVKGAI